MAVGIVKYQPARVVAPVKLPASSYMAPTKAPVVAPAPAKAPVVTPAIVVKGATGPTSPTYNFDPTGGGAITTTPTSSSTGSSTAATAKVRQNELDYKKLVDEAAARAATAALERQQAGANAQRDALLAQLASAGNIDPTLMSTLDAQKAEQEKYIADQLAQQQKQLGTAYTTAGNLQTQGFDTLRNYLTSNAPTAYANAPRATAAPITNDIAQYMQAQGVEAGRAQPGLLAANAAAQGGAANYNNLLGVLAAQSGAGQESRLAEQQMAQQLAAAQLAAYKAQQEGTLTTQQLSALQDIQTQYNTSKFQAQQQAIARQQALQDALNSLYGTGYTTPVQKPAVDNTFDLNALLESLKNIDLSNIGAGIGTM